MARDIEGGFQLLIAWLDSASKNERHTQLLTCMRLLDPKTVCRCRKCNFASSLFLLMFSSFFSAVPGPLLAPVGTQRVFASSFGHPRRRPRKDLSAEEIKARLGIPPALLVTVPTAWVRLGAQPDGPIPRFALTIPDPDDPPFAGGPRNHFPRVTRAVQYVHSRVLYIVVDCLSAREQIMLPLSPSRGPPQTNHHDSCCPPVRPTNTAGKQPHPGPVFKLYGSTAILRCFLLMKTIW